MVNVKTIVLRKVMGETLREVRAECGMTLREVSLASMVSLGYLSEIERGHKEASSEVLASVATALGVGLSALLLKVATRVSAMEDAEKSMALAA